MSFTITLSSLDSSAVFNNTPVSFTYICPKEINLIGLYEVAVISLEFSFNKNYKAVRKITNAGNHQPLNHNYRRYHIASQMVSLQCVGQMQMRVMTSFSSLRKPLNIFSSPSYVSVDASRFSQFEVRILTDTGNLAVDLEKYVTSTHIKLHFRRS